MLKQIAAMPQGVDEAQVVVAAAEPVEPVEEFDAAPSHVIEWRGAKYDLDDYDDVRIWQEGGTQQCWLTVNGQCATQVPVDSFDHALVFQTVFHNMRPRLHLGDAVGAVIPRNA